MLQARLERVLRDVFDNEELAVTDDLSQDSFSEWDSLAHVKIVIGIQEEFGVSLTTEEVVATRSVGQLKTLLAVRGCA